MAIPATRFGLALAVLCCLQSPWSFAADIIDRTDKCSSAALQALAPGGIEIHRARAVARSADAPTYCLVEGSMPTANNELRFRLGLPQAWNGKFLFEGVGGAVGLLVSVADGVRQGYAVATTDTGHEGDTGDFRWALNAPDRKIDWAYRGVHVTTSGAKALVQSYYAQPIHHAYFRGCSNGGRAGLVEAQRYPEDYDGILVGAPALNATGTILSWVWNVQALNSTPDSRLSPEDWALVGRTVRAECDAQDGLQDGLIQDPRHCELPRAKLRCGASKNADCLSPAQMTALEKIWNKPRLADGQQLFSEGHGYEDDPRVWGAYAAVSPRVLLSVLRTALPGDGMNSSAPLPAPPILNILHLLIFGSRSFHEMSAEDTLRYVFMDDPGLDLDSFDVQRDGLRLARRWGGVLDAIDPDLSPYLRRGSKLLMWHGWADSALSPQGSIDYFWRARAAVQQQGLTAQEFDDAVRLYMVPTMPHCARGAGPTEADLLGALDQWVEQGHTPQAINAVQRKVDNSVARSRPLCPIPLAARYSGQGSVDDAASFTCAAAPDDVRSAVP